MFSKSFKKSNHWKFLSTTYYRLNIFPCTVCVRVSSQVSHCFFYFFYYYDFAVLADMRIFSDTRTALARTRQWGTCRRYLTTVVSWSVTWPHIWTVVWTVTLVGVFSTGRATPSLPQVCTGVARHATVFEIPAQFVRALGELRSYISRFEYISLWPHTFKDVLGRGFQARCFCYGTQA